MTIERTVRDPITALTIDAPFARAGDAGRITSTNPFINGLVDPDPWGTHALTYYLAPNDADSNGVNDWSENGAAAAIKNAFAAWASVANLTFTEVFTRAGANFIETTYDSADYLGEHYYPESSDFDGTTGYYSSTQSVWTAANNQIGGYSYITLIHELGHGLGLEHPFETSDGDTFPGVTDTYDLGDNGFNQGVWTVMTYNDGWDVMGTSPSDAYGWEGTPMAFDIAAIQFLYGANTTYHTGADTYFLPKVNGNGTYLACIWDAGGTDTISAATATTSATINLNAATLLNAPGGGGFVSYVLGIFGGYTIANGVLIENVTGGSAADTLTGNGIANILDGRAGADTMAGGLGNDTYYVDNVGDVVTELAGGGTADTIRSSISFTLAAEVERLVLIGSAATNGTGNGLANIITGNGAANVLDGKAGVDTMNGGGGNDTYYVDNTGDVLIEAAGGGVDTARSTVTFTLAAEVEKLVLIGTAGANATGNGLGNAIYGNTAANLIDGKAGADLLTGAAGKDIFAFTTALGSTNIDHISDFSAVDDTIRLAKTIFSFLAVGALPSYAFKDTAGGVAADANDRILYNHNSGVLSYDKDGSGATAAIQFAAIDNHTILTAADFVIV